MLYVYIINIFIYSGTRLVLGSVPVWFGYFGYKNIGTVRVFEGIGPVPVSGISVWFRFGSSVPVILPRPIVSQKKLDRVELFLTRYVLHTTVNAIWRERNARKHGDASIPSEVLFRTIDRLVKNRVMSLNSPYDKRFTTKF